MTSTTNPTFQEDMLHQFNGLQMMGVDIFRNIDGTGADEFAFYSYFPDIKTANRFEDIAKFVKDENDFHSETYFKKLLLFNINPSNPPTILNEMNYLNTSSIQSEKCKPTDLTTKNTYFNWFENSDYIDKNISDALLTSIMSHLSDDFSILNSGSNTLLLTKGEGIGKYKNIVRNICNDIFVYQYKQFHAKHTNAFMETSDTHLKDEAKSMCAYIDANVQNKYVTFIHDCSTTADINNSYFAHVISAVDTYSISNSITFSSNALNEKKYLKKMFVMCFYPYFIFLFIINAVAQKNTTTMNAPRFFFIQRLIILSAYLFLYYMLLSLYVSVNSSSTHRKDILEIISNLNDHILYHEQIKDEHLTYNTMQQKTNDTNSESLQIAAMGAQVNLLKNNLTKSAMYDTRLKPALIRSKVFLIVSAFFLVIAIAGGLVIMFVPLLNKNPQYFWIYLLVVFIISIGLLTYTLFRNQLR